MPAILQANLIDQILVRPAQVKDLNRIREIYNYYVVHSTATFDFREQTATERKKWYQDHKASNLPVLVAEHEETVIGWGSLSSFNSRCGYKQTAEASFYIAPEYLGRKVGSKLLADLLSAAKDAGFHCLIAQSTGDNKASLQLLRSFGFEMVGCLRQVGYKFDRWLDVNITQKII